MRQLESKPVTSFFLLTVIDCVLSVSYNLSTGPSSPVFFPLAQYLVPHIFMTSHEGLQSSKTFYKKPSTSSEPDAVETSSNTFQKFRSTLELSLRTATRSKKVPLSPHIVDELAVLARTTKGKEKEIPKNIEPQEKMSISRKVAFGRGRDSLSSPVLHTSSKAFPSPKSQSAIPGSSSSNADVVTTSPTQQRTRKVHCQSPEHSSPNAPASPRDPLLSRHPSPELPPSSTPSLHREPPRGRVPATTRTVTLGDVLTPPDTPTPKAYTPAALRASSPIRSESPTNSVRVVPSSVRALTSASTSHLPLTSPRTPTPPPTPLCFIDLSRRVSDTRRPSTESPRHTSPIDNIEDSPRTRVRPPAQRSYSQNHHLIISSGSLVQPTSNPEHRELLRTAASLICNEVLKPPTKTEAGERDWGEVEVRMRELARLGRVWGKSDSSGACTSTNVSTAALSSCSGLTADGEERERRLFCDALRDGYVLCQCVFSSH